MIVATSLSRDEVERRRRECYNAHVVRIARQHRDLLIMRVVPDRGMPEVEPGKYIVLGLGSWEGRVRGVQDEPPNRAFADKLIKRAYSISCPMLDDSGRLTPVDRLPFLEFYITLVRFAGKHSPALTPRLFALSEGDRTYCGPRLHGNYSLVRVQPTDDVIFCGTGTGEAPHNAMLVELLTRGHAGRIVCVTCARRRRDLAYLATHREVERRHSNYRYLALTTREAENLDRASVDYVGKRYLQQYFEAGDFQRDCGLKLSPDRTHVFLSGNPAMIGAPRRSEDPTRRYPTPKGMVEVLEQLGFHVDRPGKPGNVHYEKFW